MTYTATIYSTAGPPRLTMTGGCWERLATEMRAECRCSQGERAQIVRDIDGRVMWAKSPKRERSYS